MKNIWILGFILNLSSCSFLLSPPAVAIEEELVMDAIQIAEKELELKP